MFFVKRGHKTPEGIALRVTVSYQMCTTKPTDEYENSSAKDFNIEMWMMNKIQIHSASEYEKMEHTRSDYVR